MMNGLKPFFAVTGFVWIFGGFLVWSFGPSNTSIVGASLLAFGWFG